MRIGIGLPAAVPGIDPKVIGPWASASERAGFSSLGVIDRLVYDNLEPLVALAAAAVHTERIEMLTTVLNVGYRRNPIVLAKQIASVDQLCGGRLTAGLALGGWPEDYAVSDVPLSARGTIFEATLAAMRDVWSGGVSGACGPMPALPAGRPRVLIGGLVPASFARAAAHADGWVARADALTSGDRILDELQRLAEVGCDDVVLLPCSGEIDQVGRLADAASDSFKTPRNPFGTNDT